jgi:hypothetical protein
MMAKPFVMIDRGQYRVAMDVSLPGLPQVVHGPAKTNHADVIRAQQAFEYVAGEVCWIERLVEIQFNTFSKECWV